MCTGPWCGPWAWLYNNRSSMQIHELDTSFGLGVLKRSGSMVFSLRLAAVGLLGAVTLAPEAALAFNRLPLHPTPVGASVHGAVSAVKPAAIRMRAPRSARGVRMSRRRRRHHKEQKIPFPFFFKKIGNFCKAAFLGSLGAPCVKVPAQLNRMVSVLGRCRTHSTHSTRRDGKRRPTARRCGDSELPEGSSREPELGL